MSKNRTPGIFINVPSMYAKMNTTTPNPPEVTIASDKYARVKYWLKLEKRPTAINTRETARRIITRKRVLLDTLVELVFQW